MITLGASAFFLLIVLIIIGIPIGLSLLVVGVGGLAIVGTFEAAMVQLTMSLWSDGTKFVLIAIPFYILMGNLIYHMGIAQNLFRAASYWLSWLPGGIAIASVFASAGFGAVSGSSTATTRTMGAIVIPELRRHGYNMPLATGVMSSAGTLEILIPPSIIMIFYGLMTETSIGNLFIAGVIPGISIAIIFSLIVVVIVKLNPQHEGETEIELPSWPERVRSLVHVLPVLGLFGLLLGGLYMGIFTPTEGAVISVVVILIYGAVTGGLSFSAIRVSLAEASLLTVMIYLIIVGGTLFTRFLAQTGFVDGLTTLMLSMNLGYVEFIIAITILYLVLGAVMDLFGMIILTVPVLFPIALSLGIDPVWFGIYIIIVAEIGLVTPPVGVNVYVIKTVAPDIPLRHVFVGCLPFVGGLLVFITLLAIFPEIALYLIR